jgi:hypothetical protein
LRNSTPCDQARWSKFDFPLARLGDWPGRNPCGGGGICEYELQIGNPGQIMQHGISVPATLEVAATLLSKHTLPLGLKANSNNLPWAKTERATFTLLWTGQRHVFTTCFHVLNELQEMQKGNPLAEIVAYMGSSSGLAELNGFTLLDYSKRLDVAVFRGLDDTVELPGLHFIDYESSYLADPAVGEPVSIVGYPGATVTVTRKKAKFNFMHIGLMASCVSEHRITLANETGGRQFTHYDDPTCSKISLGGLSGCPAFMHRDQTPRFVGIVTDSSDKDQTIIISRLGCIKRDGTLDHNAIPQ